MEIIKELHTVALLRDIPDKNQKHLAQLREVAEVKTICMHGSLPTEACSI